LFAIEGEAEGTLRHEAVYPCTGIRVDAEVHECRDRHGGVEVVKEAGNVEEEDASDIPASNGHLRFVTEDRRGVWSGVVFPRSKLGGADEVEVAFICSETVSNDLLQEFTCAFEEGYGVVCLCKGIIRLVGLGDDDHISCAPWVCPMF
jgi:hypothetical protein